MANEIEKIDKSLWRLLERYVKDEPWKPETVFVLSCQIKKLFKALKYYKMIDEELREKIFDLITDSPCRVCEFWDVQGHYCWLKDMHPNNLKCTLINQVLNLLKEEVGKE